MLDISERQLRGWQRQGLVRETSQFSFADLIALRTIQKLRENRIATQQIGRAIASLKKKLAHVEQPLSELKVISNGRKIAVQVAGQKMEAITGQLLFDFDAAEIARVKPLNQAAKESRTDVLKKAEFWFQRGLELEENGAPLNDAIDAYNKAIALNPEAAGALVNLGTIYYHMRRFRDAEDCYDKAIKVDPKYPLAHFNFGNLCDEWGQLDRARTYYLSALKLAPDYADAHYNMALLCERTGDYMSATRYWKAYLKIDPSSSWSAIARRQLEKLRQVTVVNGRGRETGA